jgi:hypothetical protein
MTKEEMEEMISLNMSLIQDLPIEKQKVYKKALDTLRDNLMVNDFYLKYKSIYPFMGLYGLKQFKKK